MRVTTMSRMLATLSALTLAAACNDTTGPSTNVPVTGSISVVPRAATIRSGQVVALTASLIDEHGARLSGVTIRWTSSNDAIATVAATGEVLGRGAGHAVITATAAGKSQISTIKVLAREGKPDPKGNQGLP
jgi:uncharacterized protein YjdB